MTMHLEHPGLTMLGKQKGKRKFRSAEAARKARELQELWEQNQVKWNSLSKAVPVSKSKSLYKPAPSLRRETVAIPSIDTGVKGAVTIKQTPQYTGDKILGIGTMHKSNAVPIFSDQEAKDISTMRRG